jgi:hypothetical protein
MFRKAAIVVAIALLAFATACSSSSKSVTNATGAAAAAAGTGVSNSATACPTSNTKSFAKTRFVANAALAGGAFKRYIYTPAKDGKFAKGASGRVTALIKAAAAGAFVINRLDAAKSDAEANPTLCRLIVTPLQNLKSSITGLVGKSKTGSLSGTDVNGASSQLENFRSAATKGGAGFADNTNVSV